MPKDTIPLKYMGLFSSARTINGPPLSPWHESLPKEWAEMFAEVVQILDIVLLLIRPTSNMQTYLVHLRHKFVYLMLCY